MLITNIEEYKKGKYKIYINEQFAFVLYKGELRRYGIEVGCEITNEEYEDIIAEAVLKRAKKRLMYLLKSRDYTEAELRGKLKEGCYPAEVQDMALNYVKSYNYVNDAEYARRYVETKSSVKSIKLIKMELRNKGISDSIIRDILENTDNDECELIIKNIKKKNYDIFTEDVKEKNKMFMFLARKGFSYDKICEAVSRMKYD